jgi:hypothetical protein
MAKNSDKSGLYLSVREALELIGKKRFASRWDPSCLDDETSETCAIALNWLRKALQSGDVGAFKIRHDGTAVRLSENQAAGEFFRIDLRADGVEISEVPGEIFGCRIRADDLNRYVSANAPGPEPTSPDVNRRCRQYLAECMKAQDGIKPVIKGKRHYWPEARKRFPELTKRGFYEAFKAAAEDAERPELTKAGRR